MEWIKIGMIENLIEKIGWSKSHAQVPTLLLKEDRLRVYFATRPKQDLTLTTFCDLDLQDISKIIYVHDKPILELGNKGTFDQHGIMPSSVIEKDGRVFLYYSGWCKSVGVPYNNYTGVAISDDGGFSFHKPFKGPIIDRTKFEIFSATSPDVYYDDGNWHMWYCSGTNWHEINGKLEHTYDIKYASSKNGLDWHQHNQIAIKQKNEFEAITKPSVIKLEEYYHMWYCYRGSFNFRNGTDAYKIGHAVSKDLFSWERRDEDAGVFVSENGWDSEMMAYPAITKINDFFYLFYNGNSFGKEGFGYAKLKF
ncbi:MAG TPA: hypothetical protein VK787_14695 [Puia sp.]|jgi:predicted GH43/DUF377 family glycosyl hydrolase|nr:hypothetical protein [Puia sp.]